MPPLIENALTALPVFGSHLLLAVAIFTAGLGTPCAESWGGKP